MKALLFPEFYRAEVGVGANLSSKQVMAILKIVNERILPMNHSFSDLILKGKDDIQPGRNKISINGAIMNLRRNHDPGVLLISPT